MPLSLVARYGALCAINEGGYFCHYCGCKVRRKKEQGHIDSASIDHMIPQAAGGETRMNNLVLCCLGCNAEKGTGDYLAFWNSKQEIRLRNIATRGLEKRRYKPHLTRNRTKSAR